MVGQAKTAPGKQGRKTGQSVRRDRVPELATGRPILEQLDGPPPALPPADESGADQARRQLIGHPDQWMALNPRVKLTEPIRPPPRPLIPTIQTRPPRRGCSRPVRRQGLPTGRHLAGRRRVRAGEVGQPVDRARQADPWVLPSGVRHRDDRAVSGGRHTPNQRPAMLGPRS